MATFDVGVHLSPTFLNVFVAMPKYAKIPPPIINIKHTKSIPIAAVLGIIKYPVDNNMSQDTLNTNLLGSDDPIINITQNLLASLVAGKIVDDSLENLVVKGPGVIVRFAKNPKTFIVIEQAAFKTAIAAKIKSLSVTKIKNLIKSPKAAILAVKAAFSGTKAAVTGTKAAATGTKVGTKYAASASLGPVGIALNVVMFAFDMMNLIWSLTDTSGIAILLHKADIDQIAQSTWLAMSKDDPSYFDDEIIFDPYQFMFNVNETTGAITADDTWGDVYNGHVDEYMKSIGITGDWRTKITAAEMPAPEDEPPPSESNKNTTLIIILLIAFLCLCMGFFLVAVSI